MTAAFFSNLAILLFLIGFTPYLFDIHHKRVKPHIMSWVGWGFITILGAIAMYSEGSTWIANFIAFQGVICFIIAFYAVYKKVAVYSTGKQDYVLFALGILGVVLWQLTGVAEIALVFAVMADFFFGLPTIIKVWKEPTSETRFPWGMNLLGDISALFSIQTIAFYELAYPIYLLVYDAIVFIIVFGLIKKKTSMTFSKLTNIDRQAVLDIFSKYWQDDFGQSLKKKVDDYLNKNEELKTQHFEFLLGKKDGEIVAVSVMRDAPEHMSQYAKTKNPVEFYVLAVNEQGKGIGSLMKDERIRRARGKGYTEILFFSGETHQDSWSFHDKYAERVSEMTAPNGEEGFIWSVTL